MLTPHPELVIGRNRKPKAVLIPYAEWSKVLADLEELDDIRAHDRAKTRGDEAVPFRGLKAKHSVRAWRPTTGPCRLQP